MSLCYLWWCGVLAALVKGSEATCDQINQTDAGEVGKDLHLRCGIKFCTEVKWYRLSNDTPIEENGNLAVPIEDSSIGGRVYYCQCSNQTNIECHKILVEPFVTITADPEVASEESTITITCLGEGYPQPQSSDFTLNFHLPNLTTVPLPVEWVHHIENGIQVIIPKAVFPDHSGTYKCSVAVSVTEFDPDLPIRNPILHGINEKDVYVYGVKSVMNFTVYEATPTLATMECVIYKPEELSVNWTRRGEVIPRNPNDSGFKYIMTEAVMEDRSLWVYQLTVRRLTQGDVGEYDCTVYFKGDVKGVVPVWILESDLNNTVVVIQNNSVPCSLPSPVAVTPGKEESRDCSVFIGLFAGMGAVALLLLVAIVVVVVHRCLKKKSGKDGYSSSLQQQNNSHQGSFQEIPLNTVQTNQYTSPPVLNREVTGVENSGHTLQVGEDVSEQGNGQSRSIVAAQVGEGVREHGNGQSGTNVAAQVGEDVSEQGNGQSGNNVAAQVGEDVSGEAPNLSPPKQQSNDDPHSEPSSDSPSTSFPSPADQQSSLTSRKNRSDSTASGQSTLSQSLNGRRRSPRKKPPPLSKDQVQNPAGSPRVKGRKSSVTEWFQNWRIASDECEPLTPHLPSDSESSS